jgi:hypothetical protein
MWHTIRYKSKILVKHSILIWWCPVSNGWFLLVCANLRSLSIIMCMVCLWLRRYDHVSEYSRNILGCSLSKYYEFRACCMLFKTIKTTYYPSYFNENLFFESSRRAHRLLCLTTPSYRTTFYVKTFFVSIVNSWTVCLWRWGAAQKFWNYIFRNNLKYTAAF